MAHASEPARSSFAARWAIARAALIAVTIALGLVHGCPLPSKEKTPGWAMGVVDSLRKAQRAVLSPIAFLDRDLDINQRWSLFRSASRKRFRLYVEGRTADGEWRLLYRAGDDGGAYEDLLEYRRIRGTYNPQGQRQRGQYGQFADWMTARVLADYPDFVAARTRFERIEIDGGRFTPTGEFVFERTRERRIRRRR